MAMDGAAIRALWKKYGGQPFPVIPDPPFPSFRRKPESRYASTPRRIRARHDTKHSTPWLVPYPASRDRGAGG